jgi:ribonucleoside-diphosphate reductase alpha chain
MERVERKEMWSLMCPDQCPGLVDAYGDKFRELYENYEKAGYYKKKVRAEELWYKIIESQIETGSPYMCYKDTVNVRNNQKNIGTIKSSNLCTEIMLYTAPDETAVCNLASVCLPSYVKYKDNGAAYFDHDELHNVTRVIVVNLNNVIDNNYYPSEAARKSNLSHRPIGIGVMGLADVYHMLQIPYDSEMARELNAEIFATMYHAALERSMELSRERNEWYIRYMQLCNIRYRQPDQQAELDNLQMKLSFNEWELKNCSVNRMGAYSSFEGSPASQGILQFDMAGKMPSSRYNWTTLKRNIMQHGLRNSQLLAPMPTASTAQIMGFNEAFEAYTSNIYVRQTSAGEFPIVNARLVKDLMNLGLWNNDMREDIIANDGNINSIEKIPENLRELYKSVWNIQTKHIINMAADRGIYICQSQSLNIFVANPTMAIMHKIHMYGWKMGLKTGMYYLRTLSKAKTQQFTVDPKKSKGNALKLRLLEAETECTSCSV